jgi:hypothetical protein
VSRVDKAKVDGAIGSRSERDVEKLSLAGVESGLWNLGSRSAKVLACRDRARTRVRVREARRGEAGGRESS